ncbi:hypothetical protein BJ138DRAFT_1196105 [Hygrophoropsis aurantiaca]|uniref:Uncharacterized protein n=1 Tax=Hygrophoropsis aurantiaca TaxID=72124 RepID=A0ACB7ZQI9_9AGAM|nr:hypothetical protein BJ138DRAFT_1196105 [Hygrophoropsis aurantiaca]
MPAKKKKKTSRSQAAQFRRAQQMRWPKNQENKPSGNVSGMQRARMGHQMRSGEVSELRKTLTNVENQLETVMALCKARKDQVQHQKVELALHRSELHAKNNALREAEAKVSSIQASLTRNETKLTNEKAKFRHFHTLLRYEHRKVDRATAATQFVVHRLKEIETVVIPEMDVNMADTMKRQEEAVNCLVQKLGTERKDHKTAIDHLKRRLAASETRTRRYQTLATRTTRSLRNLVKKHHKEDENHRDKTILRRLHQKGAYEGRLRTIAMSLVQSGCAREAIGPMIQKIADALGIRMSRSMSRRTVGRIVLEKGLASMTQVAHEISQASSITISSDGTSHRHINYESRHIALQTPSYSKRNEDASEEVPSSFKHSVRLLGVDSSVNHSSETQLNGWKNKANDLVDLYNESPLAQRTQSKLTALEFTRKLKGVNGDHAADQLKTFGLISDWKRDNAYLELGHEILSRELETLPPSIAAAAARAHDTLIAEAGGQSMWNNLSRAEKETRETHMKYELARKVGEELFTTLTDSERREWTLIVRAGCCMHKELNSVKGGNAAMMGYWEANGLEGPILLANKDNAATLQGVSEGSSSLTAAETRALEVTTRGAVKTTNLAGALFNHKDDKKGLQDSHRQYMQQVKGDSESCTFPDTSNTRYQSHCEAAAELITFLSKYIDLLLLTRDKKEKRTFNHLEANLYAALHDIPTRTELVVLILYAAAVTHPYMRAVRGPGTETINVLDLGPLHSRVKEHIQNIIDSPQLLLGPQASYESGALDGKEWEKPAAIAAVRRLAPTLPHLEPVLVTFFKGALVTWNRFTAEYSPGSLIDQLSSTEHESAWMPSTNDANEGALGSMRLHARQKPVESLHQYNSQAMYRRNNTEALVSSIQVESRGKGALN